LLRFLEGPIQGRFPAGRQIDLAYPGTRDGRHLFKDGFRFLLELNLIDADSFEKGRNHPFFLLQERPQKMFRLHLLVPDPLGQALGFLNYFLRFKGQFIETHDRILLHDTVRVIF